MSVAYTAIGWNRNKRRYDATAAAGAALFIATFLAVQIAANPAPRDISIATALIRATGVCAILLLHIILAIGPACRLDRRLLPLLYNRRHLGVMLFFIALAHGLLSIVWYHAFGNINPALSLLSANTRFDSLREFPFELLGIAGLLWLFLMAATSHDFWLKNLTPRIWKTLHMGVYVAYALLIMHIALGLLQGEHSPVFTILLVAGTFSLAALHLYAGLREQSRDAAVADTSDWIDACAVADIPDNRARTICLPRGEGAPHGKPERVAIFKYAGKLSAVGNVCRHQGGPLGEGKVIDGCITCPWHGYQYRPHDGSAPPPFDDKVPTYRVRITRGRVEIDPRALPPGTPVEPASINQPQTQ